MKSKIKSNKNIFGLTFQITKNCNFNCSYCYEINQHKDENSKINDIKDVIEFCEEKSSRDDCVFDLTFIGGEPTLNAEYAKKIQQELLDRNLINVVSLITNGWSKKAVEDFFIVSKDQAVIQISYDGYDINEKYRRKNGLSTTDTVLKTVKGLISDGWHVGLKSTLPIDAIHLVPKILKEFADLSDDVQQYLTYNVTEDFTTTFSNERCFEEYKSYFDKHFAEILKFEVDRFKRGLPPVTRWFSDYSSTKTTTTCKAGVGFITINEKNKMHYCQHVDYVDEAKNQLEYDFVSKKAVDTLESIKKSIQKNIDEQQSECDSCTALYCVKCPILNFSITKDKDKMHGKHAIPFMCEYYKNLSKFLYIYDKIKEN